LALYPTVPETLAAIRGKGTIIVGYTESKAFYASYRIRKLGLDGVLDFLYSPEDDDLPSGIRAEDIRKYPPSHYKLLRTIHRHTPRGIAKPSPDVLTAIIKEIGAEQTQVAYVGDKLFKDIAMAQDAGVIDLWAKYGDARQSSEYELLKAVTHWPQAMVEKERATKASELKPSYVLEKDFSEILEHLEFVAHVNTGEESVKRVLEIWKKTVDVQQHFNDLCLRIRNYAISVYVTIIGAAGLAIKERWNVSLPRGINFPVSSLFFFAGAVAMLMFGYMDRDWYHRLLYGAVKHSMWLEERYARILPELGLSKTIKDESPASFFFWNIHAASKLLIFYLFLFLSLVALGAACIFTYS
jgi:phosphoglycolate phosphatase-like HAD superfamily hydrolase